MTMPTIRSRIRFPFVALLTITLALAASLAVAAVAPEEADAYYVNTWTWNIYGTCSGSGNCGSTRWAEKPENVLGFMIAGAADRPWTVSLSEVCALQYLAIAQKLIPLGYDGVFAKSNGTPGNPSPIPGHPFNPVNCGTGNAQNGKFGNATFFLGVKANPEDVHYFAADLQVPGDDVRNIVCVQVNTFGGLRQECSTHLDPNSNPASPGTKQVNQDNTAAFIAGSLANSALTTLGGDRNMTTWGNWSSLGFIEIDVQSPKQRTHSISSLSNKLDWIWAGPGHAASGTQRYCPPSTHYSDHCMLFGGFWIW